MIGITHSNLSYVEIAAVAIGVNNKRRAHKWYHQGTQSWSHLSQLLKGRSNLHQSSLSYFYFVKYHRINLLGAVIEGNTNVLTFIICVCVHAWVRAASR